MGCCVSQTEFPSTSSDLSKLEERCIQSSETMLYRSFFLPVCSSLEIPQWLSLDGLSLKKDSILFAIVSGLEHSSFKLILTYHLLSDNSSDEKAWEILELLSQDSFSYGEVASLVDSLIEIASRTLPFLVYSFKDMDEYNFYYYVSSLAKSKHIFRENCILELIGTAKTIDKCSLAERLAASSLVYSYLIRQDLWNLHNSRSLSQTDCSSLPSLTPRRKLTIMEDL